MPIGTVKFFDKAKGYGFITNEAAERCLRPYQRRRSRRNDTLEKEQRLSYELENNKRGKTSAVNLQNASIRGRRFGEGTKGADDMRIRPLSKVGDQIRLSTYRPGTRRGGSRHRRRSDARQCARALASLGSDWIEMAARSERSEKIAPNLSGEAGGAG